MENNSNQQDALGQDIIIGNRYGYSQNKNGFTHIVIGKAKNFTKSGVSITVESAKRALYSNKPEPMKIKSTVNVKALNLFPIL